MNLLEHDEPLTDATDAGHQPPGTPRGRETGGVSDLPPPQLPPPAPNATSHDASSTASDSGSNDASSTASDSGSNDLSSEAESTPWWRGLLGESGDPDWDRIRDLTVQWFRPLAEPSGWVALGYLFVGMLSSIGFFVAMVVVGAITLGLSFVVVGLLLIGPWFAMVSMFANAERAMARWVGYEIPPRDRKSSGALGWRSVTDPERWRMVAYLAVNVLIAPILFALGSFCYTFVIRVAGGWGSLFFDNFFPFNALAGILVLLVAVVALGAAPRVVRCVATFKANVTAWFLGPDKLALAEQRVSALSTQRQDILDAVAVERRRIERNLHDGVQQQLVAIGLDLGMAEQQLDRDPDRARELVVQAREKVRGSIGELRQLGRGLHPAILEDRGIDAALSAVVSAAPIPISIQIDDDLDLDTDVAETVYFVANEAIANVLKHSRARTASVHVGRVAANVRVAVHDDGRGGADPSRGTGLAGIRARVNAVDGSMVINSPSGGPTTIVVELPRRVEREEVGRDV